MLVTPAREVPARAGAVQGRGAVLARGGVLARGDDPPEPPAHGRALRPPVPP